LTSPTQPQVSTERPRGSTLVIGVLGGIASGKSEVARLLAGAGGLVIDADRLAHEVLDSPDSVRRLRERLGQAVFASDGRVDRAALARRVFDDPKLKRELEAWIHPAVRAHIAEQLAAARASRTPRVVLDVPLLLENDAQHHLVPECDALVFVDAPLAVRNARAVAVRGWSTGELARREATQMPLSTKAARAHATIRNDGSLAALETQVVQVLSKLESR
jgi:dephospho-CoA kinase